jgi:hypothetical protein
LKDAMTDGLFDGVVPSEIYSESGGLNTQLEQTIATSLDFAKPRGHTCVSARKGSV